jgi:hypothetical protein
MTLKWAEYTDQIKRQKMQKHLENVQPYDKGDEAITWTDYRKVGCEDEWWIANTMMSNGRIRSAQPLVSITRDFVFYEGCQKNVKSAMKMLCVNLNFALPSILFNDLFLVL